jgi:hypothetical protein
MYVQYKRKRERKEKWVGDEIDAMMDNILFLLFLSEKKVRWTKKKKRTFNANFNVVFICTFSECY